MLRETVTERQEQALADERALLGRLVQALGGLGYEGERRRVDDVLGRLDPLFLLAVAGGEGAELDGLVDALLGGAAAPPAAGGPRLRWIEGRERGAAGAGGRFRAPEDAEVLAADLPALEHLSVAVAPPGDAGGWGGPADLALFVTSAHRALPPPEHPLLLAAADGARRLLLVVDGVDMLRLAEDVERMEEAAAVTAERLLGFRPFAQGVTAARPGADGPPAGRESLLPALASRVAAELRRGEVVRPKLLEPLDAAARELDAARRAASEERASLEGDLENLAALEEVVDAFDREAEAALAEALAEAERSVEAYGDRAGTFIRRASRPFRFPPSLRRLAERFEAEALDDLPPRVRRAAAGLDRRMGDAVEAGRSAAVARLTEHPTERSRARPPAELGEAPGTRELRGGDTRGNGGATGPALNELEADWSPPAGGELVAALSRGAFYSLGLVALGLLLALLPVALGPLERFVLPPALGMALGGAAVLGAVAAAELRRRHLVRGLARELGEQRSRVAAALAAAAERSAAAGRRRLTAPVAPYVDAVTAARDRLEEGRIALDRLAGELASLRSRVEGL